jgi:hypothetical protein
MRIKELKEYLEEKYFKEGQKLQLTTSVEKEEGRYFAQEIEVGDYDLCEIRTFDCLDCSQVGHVPYCIKSPWGEYEVTVQRFGELTDGDVEKAIAYVLGLLGSWSIWNIYLDGKMIDRKLSHDYTYDSDFLRQMSKWKKKI